MTMQLSDNLLPPDRNDPSLRPDQPRFSVLRFGQTDYIQSLLYGAAPEDLVWLSVAFLAA